MAQKQRRKLHPEPRKAFILLMAPDLYDEVSIRAAQRFNSMTAYIVKAVLDRIAKERKYE